MKALLRCLLSLLLLTSYGCAAQPREEVPLFSQAELDQILDEEIREPFEGRHINLDHPAFATGRPIPTCEALARWLFPRIARRLPSGVTLARVRVAEDDTLHADCTGTD